MKPTIWMGTILGAATMALASGCGGPPGGALSTPTTIGDDSGNPNGRPADGTSRGDGTGVPAGDKDPLTNDEDSPSEKKETPPSDPPPKDGPGPR